MPPSFLARVLSASVALTLLLPGAGILTIELAHASHSQCSDGVDNDSDRRFDYPEDTDCTSMDDNTEDIDNGMFLTLTDGKEVVNQGDPLIYIITLKQQRDPVQLVDVSLHVPAQYQIVSTSDDGRIVDGSIRWQKVAVFQSSVRRLQVHVVVSPYARPGQLLLSRLVAGGNSVTDTTMVNSQSIIPYPQNQLEVTVTDHRDRVLPGEQLEYVVIVRNPEPSIVAVHLRVKIPVMLFIMDAPGAGFLNDEMVWQNVTLRPGEQQIFTFRGSVDARTPQGYPIQVVARAGNVVGSDRTIVGGTPFSLTASITDSRENASRGDLLTYVIHINNRTARLESDANVGASLPVYGEFVAVNDGGIWDGKNVRWQHLQVAPGGSRDLAYTVRVRTDAPDGAILRATTTVQGFTVSDTTRVGGGPLSYRGGAGLTREPLLVQKTSSDQNATAGSLVSYGITVRNTDGFEIRNIVVSDSYDSSALAVTDPGSGRFQNGTIAWKIDSLRPGEVRTFRYTGRLARTLPPGSAVQNTARAFTSDVAYVPTASSTVDIGGVFLPQTGAEQSGEQLPLFLGMLMFVGFMTAGTKLRKRAVL